MANYINDAEFYAEIVLSKGRGKLTPRAAIMIQLIGKNLIRKKEQSYVNIADKEDCLQQGLFRCYENWYKFNEKKYSSPFNYFSEVFKRGMVEGYRLLSKNQNNTEYLENII